MKSIRTDDVKVTAKDLGVKVGDKFIVLSEEESFKSVYNSSKPRLPAGTVVVLVQDDDTSMPYFKVIDKEEELYMFFSYLARYEEPKEEKIMLDKVKFDMKAIAEELGISLSTAHQFVQEMLFEAGNKWMARGKNVQYENSEWLFVKHGSITYDNYDSDSTYAQLSLELKKSFVVKKEGPPEVIEVDGHKYILVK